MNKLNCFNILNNSDFSDENDDNVSNERKSDFIEKDDFLYFDDNSIIGRSVYDDEFIDDEFIDDKNSSKKDIYERYRAGYSRNFNHEMNSMILNNVTPEIIDEFQAEPITLYATTVDQFRLYDSKCNSEFDEFSELLTKARTRLINLIQRKSDETPIEQLELKYSQNFKQFFPQIEGIRCEKFKEHHLMTGMIGYEMTLNTWLSFNTELKTTNKNTQRKENLKLFIITLDKIETDDDLCMNNDLIHELNQHYYKLMRDYKTLKNMKQTKYVTDLLLTTERRIRKFYNLNYIPVLSNCFKFCVTFDTVRYIINKNHSSIAVNKEKRHKQI